MPVSETPVLCSQRPEGVLNFGTDKGASETVWSRLMRASASLPPAAWARIVVLFFALGLMKIILLMGLGQHLYQVHWRIGGAPQGWCNTIAFYVFVSLGVISLVQLAGHCRAVGVKAVRAANFTVLPLGLLFIFLTFHSGKNNYLYPITEGILRWTSLGPYLSLDFCFRPPYLAAWLLGYALAYYVLARTGCETWALHLTAACAGAYGFCFLGELGAYRNELLVVDCLGIISLLTALLPLRKSQWVWLLAPAIWTAGFAGELFCLSFPHSRASLLYLFMILGGGVVLFAVATFISRKWRYFGPWSNVLLFLFFTFLLFANSHYPLAANSNNAICLGLEAPRYFMGELLVVGALAICAALYHRFWPKAGFWWLDIAGLGLIALAFIDLRLSRIIGVRLGWDLLSFGDSPRMMARMVRPYLPGALVGLGIGILAYAIAVRALQRYGRRAGAASGASQPGRYFWYAFASFVLLGALGLVLASPDDAEGQAVARLVSTSPLWKRVANHPLGREEFLRSARALGLGELGTEGKAQPSGVPRNLNVLLIFLESSYNRHLSLFGSSEDTEPLLSQYRDRMELFPNFFSDYASSIHARFATFTSLYPVRDFNAFTQQRVGVQSLFEVLHDNGYTCSLFYSSFLDYTGFRDFLRGRGIDEMYDADTMPGKCEAGRVSWGLREDQTLAAMLSQIRKYAAGNQRFFMTYVPAAPHYPYDGVPDRFHRFKPTEMNDYTPFYLNELLSIDWVMASLVDQLKTCGLLDKTLVVITNDHGERTGEHGGPIGHGWYLTPELANTPLIIMDPHHLGCRTNYTIGSQIDVLPTVLDVLRIPLPPGELYEGRSLYAPPAGDDRLVYLNTYDQYGIVSGRTYISGARKTDEAGAAGTPRLVYSISNQGTKTLFTEDRAANVNPVSILPFDQFQESLLRNYSFYCKAVWKGPEVASSRSRQH